MTQLSVVIPTYNGSATLPACLRALEREQAAGHDFEVIVVDDGSTDGTPALLRELQQELELPFRILCQHNAGPAAARNRGVDAASGDLILFLGDDIVVQHPYLQPLCRAYASWSDERHGVLGSTHYSPDCIPTPFGRWLEESDLQFAYRQAEPGKPLPFALFYTSNLLVPRRALLDAGGFNPGFRYAAYEDTELGYRLAQRGFQLYYCPEAVALHLHPVSIRAYAHRMEMAARALFDLRALNPQLFTELYPDAEAIFAHPPRRRRTVRAIRATVLLEALTLADAHLPWQLPDFLYRGALKSVFSREVTRLWTARSAAGVAPA